MDPYSDPKAIILWSFGFLQQCTFFSILRVPVQGGVPCTTSSAYPGGSSDWHRAVVTFVSSEPHLCQVFYVDYGVQGMVARASRHTLKSVLMTVCSGDQSFVCLSRSRGSLWLDCWVIGAAWLSGIVIHVNVMQGSLETLVLVVLSYLTFVMAICVVLSERTLKK